MTYGRGSRWPLNTYFLSRRRAVSEIYIGGEKGSRTLHDPCPYWPLSSLAAIDGCARLAAIQSSVRLSHSRLCSCNLGVPEALPWLQGPDLNRQPRSYEPLALPSCATLQFSGDAGSRTQVHSASSEASFTSLAPLLWGLRAFTTPQPL